MVCGYAGVVKRKVCEERCQLAECVTTRTSCTPAKKRKTATGRITHRVAVSRHKAIERRVTCNESTLKTRDCLSEIFKRRCAPKCPAKFPVVIGHRSYPRNNLVVGPVSHLETINER